MSHGPDAYLRNAAADMARFIGKLPGMTMDRRARVAFIPECEVEVYMLRAPAS